MPAPSWWPPGLVWPENNTGLGGPDDRNLTNVYDQLTTMDGRLSNIDGQVSLLGSLLEQIRDAVLRLSGEAVDIPTGWLGLPWAWGSHIGSTSAPGLLNIQELLGAIDSNTGNTVAAVQDAHTQAAADALLLQQLLGDANALLVTTDASAAALALVMGELTSPPTDATIKSLLRSIDINQARAADCCEEGQTQEPPPDNDPNPEPLNISCDATDYPYIRNTGWQPASPPLLAGGAGLEGWVPTWSGVSAAFDGDLSVDSDTTGFGVPWPAFVNTNLGYDACLKWDFTGNVVPQLASWYRFGSGDFYTGNETGTNISPLNVPVGGALTAVNQNIRWAPVFYTAEGAGPPGNNVWLTVVFGAS